MDAATLKHLRAWADRRFYPEDRDAKVAAFIAWFDALDEADRDHWLNAGWPQAFDAAGIV